MIKIIGFFNKINVMCKNMILLVFLSFISLNVFAEVGCAATNTGTPDIWTNFSGIFGHTSEYAGTPGFSSSVKFNAITLPSSTCSNFYKGTPLFGSLGSCKIYNVFANPSVVNGYSVIYALNCPIDDYIPYLFLGIGGLGFVFIRKRNLAL